MAGRNAEIARTLIEDGIGRGDMTVVDRLVAADCIEHQRGLASGAAGVRQLVETLHAWMSDLALTVVDSAEAGDLVWARNRATGVNTGAVFGHPPTGRRVEVEVFDLVRIVDGHVVEHWGVADQLGLLVQLGIFDPRAAAAPR